MPRKLKIFIGSASESQHLTDAVAARLARDKKAFEVLPWTDAFPPGTMILRQLENLASTCDFGIFVFSPDDRVVRRGQEARAARDNVVLEAGMFIGALGSERSFVLSQRRVSEAIFMPSDFGGFVRADFDADSASDSEGGLEDVVDKIATRMRELGPVRRNTHDEVRGLLDVLAAKYIKVKGKNVSIAALVRVAAKTHSTRWSVLIDPEVLMDLISSRYPDKVADELYWWLVVEGIFKFHDIEIFTSGGWHWKDSIRFVALSGRGAEFLNLLRTE